MFIHGLIGHRDHTWTAHGKSIPWMKEFLPQDITDARIITYGYDSSVVRWGKPSSQNTVREHARNLVIDLLAIRRSNPNSAGRPIVFVTHSLGGLVCEDALLSCHTQSQSDPEQDLLSCTYGIVFLGTPHAGSDFTPLAKSAASLVNLSYFKQANKELLEVLSRRSPELSRIEHEFLTLVQARLADGHRKIELFSFVEELVMQGTGHVRSCEPIYSSLKLSGAARRDF